MTALAIRQPQMAAEVQPDSMFKMAKAIADGRLFGSQDPNAVFTLMLLAQAEGKHPGLVMRDYHVINGKPAKKADAMLVDFLASGGKVEWHSLTDDLADATFSHPAGGTVRISWDEKRVQAAQLGSNPMHKKYPRQMKRARVISEGVRTVYPGATGGLYVPEEVQDFADERPAPVVHEVEAKPAKRGSYEAKAQAAEVAAANTFDEEIGAVKEWAKNTAASLDMLDAEAIGKAQTGAQWLRYVAILEAHAPNWADRLKQAVADRLDALEAQA